MRSVRQTSQYDKWFGKLSDRRARSKIIVRIQRAQEGNFGDHKGVGDGVSELRIPEGPGYRVYYSERAEEILLLLIGGDKDSQERDIEKAKAILKELNEQEAEEEDEGSAD